MKTKFILVAVFTLTLLSVLAQQGRKDLERERKRVQQAMKNTKRELKNTKKEKNVTQQRVSQVQGKLEEKKEVISDVTTNLSSTQKSISRTSDVISSLATDVEKLKETYTQTVRRTFRQKINHSLLLFLFSSESFNQAFRRFQYIRQYDKFRKKQVAGIASTQQVLKQKIYALTGTKESQQETLDEVTSQAQNLGRELTEKEKELQSLKQKESNLKQNLAEQERNHQKLSASIEDFIQKELEARRRATLRLNPSTDMVLRSNIGSKNKAETTTREPRKNEAIPTESAESKALSDSFNSNKGKLPWPVGSGTISRVYGKQRHPDAPTVWITNNGIDINTANSSNVNAVFKGRVLGIQFITGVNYMVIVEHGTYYSVYSNLDRVYAKVGDEIDTRQAIGRLAASGDLHIEIWNGGQRQNPKLWLKR